MVDAAAYDMRLRPDASASSRPVDAGQVRGSRFANRANILIRGGAWHWSGALHPGAC